MINNFIDKFIVREYKFKCLIFSVISGILLALSFERFNVFPLAWVSFVPLIYCIYKSNFKYSLLYGFITGFVYSLISINWMFLFLLTNTKSFFDSFIVSIIVWIGLSLFIAAFSGISNCVKNYNKVVFVIFAASVWIVFEYIRNYYFGSFPINLLGYSQGRFYPMVQIADIFGVYGMSFFIMIINVLLFYWLIKKSRKYLLISIIIVLSLLFYGGVRIYQISNMQYERKLKVGVVQPDIERYMKRGKKYKEKIINRIYESAQYLKDKKCNVSLYPETLLPKRLAKDPKVKNLMRKISKYSDVTLIGGKFDENKKIYNTIFIIDNRGKIINKYKKKHLVLFGEYVPFEGFLSELFKRIDLTDNLSRNENIEVFNIRDYTLGINICSENYYPYLSRELVLKGATLLTTHSNDAWCDELSYPYQHFIMNVFRAVENRKYLAVSGNTGISGVISPIGKILKQTKDLEQTAFEETVYTNNYITIYDRIGDLFVYLCMIYVLVILSFLLYTKIKNKKFFNGISKKSQQ